LFLRGEKMRNEILNFSESTDYYKDLVKAKEKIIKVVEFGPTAKFVPELMELKESDFQGAKSKFKAGKILSNRILASQDLASLAVSPAISQFIADRLGYKLLDGTYYIDRIVSIAMLMQEQSILAYETKLSKGLPSKLPLEFDKAILSTLAAIKKIRFGSLTSKPESGYSSIRLLEAIENLEFRQVEKRQSKKVNYNRKLAKISVENEYKETSQEAEILAKLQIQADVESLIGKLKKPQAVKLLGLCCKLLITSKAKIYINNILRRYASNNLKSLGLLDFIYVIKEYSKE
jgi:hypothetical protein